MINPASFITLKGTKRKIAHYILSSEELMTLYLDYEYKGNKIVNIRNKALLGLIIFQGLNTIQLERLSMHDLRLRTGKVFVPGSLRSNERWMRLIPEQLLDMMTYRLDIRKELIALTGKKTDQLFITIGQGANKLNNVKCDLIKQLKRQNRRVKDYKQIRASVITNWLKSESLRKTQYKAGHRFISSTECYEGNDMDSLKEDLEVFFPLTN